MTSAPAQPAPGTPDSASDPYELATPWAEALNRDLDEFDARAEFPWEKWKTIQRSGILAVPFEKRWGGLGGTLTETMRALEGLGHTCRDAGLSFSASTQIVSVGVPLQAFAA